VANGSTLQDPEHLLEGSGKVHRYVRLESADDLRNAALKALLRSSREAARARFR